ncbi:MAG: hypothetical protein ABIB71_07275 [Candidatus Woesearchaeota archaeon]
MKTLLAAGLLALLGGCADLKVAIEVDKAGLPSAAYGDVKNISENLTEALGEDKKSEANHFAVELYKQADSKNIKGEFVGGIVEALDDSHEGTEEAAEIREAFSYIIGQLPPAKINSLPMRFGDFFSYEYFDNEPDGLMGIARLFVFSVRASEKLGIPIYSTFEYDLNNLMESAKISNGKGSAEDARLFLEKILKAGVMFNKTEELKDTRKIGRDIWNDCQNETSDNLEQLGDAYVAIIASSSMVGQNTFNFFEDYISSFFTCEKSLLEAVKSGLSSDNFNALMAKFESFEYSLGDKIKKAKAEEAAVQEKNVLEYIPIALQQYADTPIKFHRKKIEISAYPVSQIMSDSQKSYALKLMDDGFSIDCMDNGITYQNLLLHNDIEYVIKQNEMYGDKKVTAFGTLMGDWLLLDAVEVEGKRRDLK